MAKAPDFVKEAFRQWVETWGWETKDRVIQPYRELVMDVGPKKEDWPLPKLLGKLWRCDEVLPKDLADRMDLLEGSTYARAAQSIMSAARRGRFHIPRSGFRVPG